MAQPGSSKQRKKERTTRSLMVRLDDESKAYLSQAAALRHMSMSDFVRTVTVAQARKEVDAARQQTIVLTSEEQLAFWNALNDPPQITNAQRRLGAMMRGES